MALIGYSLLYHLISGIS